MERSACPQMNRSVEIAAFGDDFDVARVAGGGRAPRACGVALAQSRKQRFVAQMAKHVTMVLEPPGDDVDHAVVLIPLDDPVDGHQPRPHHDLALPSEDVGPY